jgi:4-hydroxy-tetrahydrodipicolinate synthase
MFKGVITALVTPLRNDRVDEEALRRLVDEQITSGVDGLVPVGTTGESPTLTSEEHIRVVEIVVQQAKQRVPVIAGTGANSTHEAIELTLAAKAVGADATLQVTPYYNKPTQDGLYRRVCPWSCTTCPAAPAATSCRTPSPVCATCP